jgi:uncharacterized membrane protein required for colicin V production
MADIQVNYLAILVVSIICYLLGALWYSPPLFANQWMRAIGKTEEDLKGGASASTYVITFVVWVVTSYVLAVFIHYSGASSFGYGMLAGFLCWFGFYALLSLMMSLFEQKPKQIWLINVSYVLVAFLISGGILAIWK